MASLYLNKTEASVLRKFVDQMSLAMSQVFWKHNFKDQSLTSDQFYSKKLCDITQDLSLLP